MATPPERALPTTASRRVVAVPHPFTTPQCDSSSTIIPSSSSWWLVSDGAMKVENFSCTFSEERRWRAKRSASASVLPSSWHSSTLPLLACRRRRRRRRGWR